MSASLHYLEPDEVASLLAAANASGRTGKRNAALLATLYYAGLRVSEACYLRCSDIDIARRVLRVPREGKTGEREQYIPDDLVPWLEQWGRMRDHYARRNPSIAGDWYFISTTAHRITRFSVNGALKRYAIKAGLYEYGKERQRVHPHTLRHSYAMAILRNPSADITDVQTALGHATLSSTLPYLHADKRRHSQVMRSTQF